MIRRERFVRRLEERVLPIPGRGNVHLNVLNARIVDVVIDGVENPSGRDFHRVDRVTVNEGFFEAAGIRILRGRNFLLLLVVATLAAWIPARRASRIDPVRALRAG